MHGCMPLAPPYHENAENPVAFEELPEPLRPLLSPGVWPHFELKASCESNSSQVSVTGGRVNASCLLLIHAE